MRTISANSFAKYLNWRWGGQYRLFWTGETYLIVEDVGFGYTWTIN